MRIELTPKLLEIGLYTTDKDNNIILVTEHPNSLCCVANYYKTILSAPYDSRIFATLPQLEAWMETISDSWIVDFDHIVGTVKALTYDQRYALTKMAEACYFLNAESLNSKDFQDFINQEQWFNKPIDTVVADISSILFQHRRLSGPTKEG